VALLYSGSAAAETLRAFAQRQEDIPAPLAESLRSWVPPGAQVFTCGWGRTGDLLLALPGRKFQVALDPTLFYLKDPELYRLWFEIPRRPPPRVSEVIRRRFGARYVVCFWDDDFRKFGNAMAFEPGVRTLFVDGKWNVYDLGEEEPR
jgi:hypothetical protein